MISPRSLVQQAKKWQQMAALGKRRPATMGAIHDPSPHRASAIAGKGHCIVYTNGGERFEVPLAYLGTTVFGELLRMSEDEFGFKSEDKIMVHNKAPGPDGACDMLAQEKAIRRSGEGGP